MVQGWRLISSGAKPNTTQTNAAPRNGAEFQVGERYDSNRRIRAQPRSLHQRYVRPDPVRRRSRSSGAYRLRRECSPEWANVHLRYERASRQTGRQTTDHGTA